ncbi:Rieske 2Fe-2S domain-containing protein [Hydrogenophaga sp.]|uniref:Rieske 2Fe-2S domain-containing protein n=1 Tax=Hydrogenophaga sp. TaxID=1904254 RepID=UPI002719E6DF|nr:Rieske 2Fe-2S domain-containing protein [Hydrogenophaga sp.]MDO8904986.1 Rieske 2Fe-2S domain-containing protein [Hydrogenophaga sp.]
MSDALNYLLKARPDALSHYFAFLKDAGKHLDPKTRNLISVITKVDAQTERGFKQYLGRALREGSTPMEVLDALLMAFPTLGLAKIIWAVDIILEMDLPGFQPEALTRLAQWHDVMACAEVPDGTVVRTECDGRGLFIYRDQQSYQVFDSRCPHQNTDISELALKNNILTCPKHQWEFDAHSGACIKNGNSPLKRFESRVDNNRLLAYW